MTKDSAWTAHVCVTSAEDLEIDVYLTIDAKTKEKWEQCKLSYIECSPGCCGQNRCAVCSGVMESIQFIGFTKGAFPFAQSGNLQEVLDQIREYLKQQQKQQKRKEKPAPVITRPFDLRMSSDAIKAAHTQMEQATEHIIQQTMNFATAPPKKTISASDIAHVAKLFDKQPKY